MTHRLFSFGTLRQPAVQQGLFGRTVPTEPDVLDGHVVGEITITDPEVIRLSGSDRHPALLVGGESDSVEGGVLVVDDAQLAAADKYEEAAFRREEVVLRSGLSAWVYVPKDAGGVGRT